MNPVITFKPHGGGKAGEIKLATYNTESHLNIYFKGGDYGCICASPADARKLRDELLKLYPVEVAPATPKAPTYDAYLPEVGAKAQPKKGEADYFKRNNLVSPFTITKVAHERHSCLVFFTDTNGKSFNSFSGRLEAYVAPAATPAPAPWGKPVTATEISERKAIVATAEARGEERGRIIGNNVGYQAGFIYGKSVGEQNAKPKPGKWETVADGMDRLKIDGGYLYQNDSAELAFVPDQPNANAGKTLCSFTGKCPSQRLA